MKRVSIGALLVVGALVLLELGARSWFDVEQFSPTKVADVDPNRELSFLPGLQRTYTSSEFSFTVSFNRFGRRDTEWSVETLADPRSILFIGDSMVLGNAVDAQYTIPSQLEQRYAAAGAAREVYNFGGPAGGPPQYQRLMEIAFEQGIASRIVVVGIFVGNDFYPAVLRAAKRPRPPVRPARGWPGSALVEVSVRNVAASSRAVGWALMLGQWTGLPVYDTAGSRVFLRHPTVEQQTVFREILGYVGKMKNACDRSGRTLVAVIIPNKIQVENFRQLNDSGFDAEGPNRRIAEYCDEIGLSCIDLLPAMLDAREREAAELYYPIDRHLTPTGYALAADAVFETLTRIGQPPQ